MFPCKQLNKHAINNTKKNVEELAAWDAHPSSKPCRRLLDLSERSWNQTQVSAALAKNTNENVRDKQTASFSPRSLPVWK